MKFSAMPEARIGARRSRRFDSQMSHGTGIFCGSALWMMKRAEARAPLGIGCRKISAICESTSPSPRPSPQRRGRNVRRVLAKPALTSARLLSNFKNVSNGCSLSQRERVRVRENAALLMEGAK